MGKERSIVMVKCTGVCQEGLEGKRLIVNGRGGVGETLEYLNERPQCVGCSGRWKVADSEPLSSAREREG